jgi:hypothetical protein
MKYHTEHPGPPAQRRFVVGPWLRSGLPMLAACLLMFLLAEVAAACPTCKDSVAGSDPQSQSMAAGYFYSILFMMSMPFLILGTFGSVAYRAICRAREGGAGESAAVSTQSELSSGHSTAAGS